MYCQKVSHTARILYLSVQVCSPPPPNDNNNKNNDDDDNLFEKVSPYLSQYMFLFSSNYIAKELREHKNSHKACSFLLVFCYSE